MPPEESLNNLLSESLEKLELAIKESCYLSRGKNKLEISKLGEAVSLIQEFQQEIYKNNPELKPALPSEYIPDPDLTKEQFKLASQLSTEQLNEIDATLLANTSREWKKVAMVVGMTMSKLPSRVTGIPDVFYAQRVKKLVSRKILESQGNLDFMRYSEIRLPKK